MFFGDEKEGYYARKVLNLSAGRQIIYELKGLFIHKRRERIFYNWDSDGIGDDFTDTYSMVV